MAEWVQEYRQTDSLKRRQELAAAIFGEVYPALRQYVLRAGLGNAAEDVLQETLSALARNLHLFEGNTASAFWAWCYRITRRKVADQIRHRPRWVPMDPEELREAVEASAEVSPIETGERADLEETMALLQRVQPPCYDYLVEHYLHGATLAELALEHGLSYDAMRMRFNRCLKLAQRLTAERNREVTDGH